LTLQADYLPDLAQSLVGVSILKQPPSGSAVPNVAIYQQDKLRFLPIVPAVRGLLGDLYETSSILSEAPNHDGLDGTIIPEVKQECAEYWH